MKKPTGYRLIATDLDGTLLRSDGSLTATTLATLYTLRERGIETIFVTARHAGAVVKLPGAGSVVSEAVVCAGAACCELSSGHIRTASSLHPDTAAQIVADIRAAVPGTKFGWVTAQLPDDLSVEPDYFPPGAERDWPVGDVDAVKAPILKLFARSPKHWQGDFVRAVAGELGARASIAHSTAGLVDIASPGVSKLAALRALCAERRIPAHAVIAFGDTAADLAMLRWAGSGVAVANAEREVREAADAVAGSCDAEGVAGWLRDRFGG